jgi:cation-transporting ATPase 13A3/4/5
MFLRFAAMCGDGANDCGALKAAHVGISLSEAESSVASPFTSRDANISCVPKVIREGRAALSTSSGIFKFMVTYALTEFLSCIILYAVESNLFDLQFLFIDICLIVNFGFFFGKTQAYAGPLVKDPPLTSLLSFIPLMSITLHVVVMTAIQLGAFFWVRQFPWYSDYKRIPDSYACYENYAVYCVSLFQYIASAVTFSQGKPYRKEIYTNVALMTSLVIMTLICAYKTMYPAQWITDHFGYIQPPAFDFKVRILTKHFFLWGIRCH